MIVAAPPVPMTLRPNSDSFLVYAALKTVSFVRSRRPRSRLQEALGSRHGLWMAGGRRFLTNIFNNQVSRLYAVNGIADCTWLASEFVFELVFRILNGALT